MSGQTETFHLQPLMEQGKFAEESPARMDLISQSRDTAAPTNGSFSTIPGTLTRLSYLQTLHELLLWLPAWWESDGGTLDKMHHESE